MNIPNPTPPSDRSHSLLGGSSCHIWANCPGALFLWKDLPPQAPTKYTIEGNQAHLVAEKVLDDWLNYRLTGSDPDIGSKFLEGTDEMFDAAQEYKNHVWEKVFECNVTSTAYGLEEKLVFSKEYDSYGFVDCWAVNVNAKGKPVGAVVDYKFGFMPVNVEGNPQLAFYACALREELRLRGKDLDQVKGVIFQPRRTDGLKYQEVIFTSKQLDVWKKRLLRAMEQIYITQKPKFKVGEYCQFCRAQGVCPTYKKQLDKDHALIFSAPEAKNLPSVETLTDDVILNIWRHEAKILSFMKAVRAYIMQRASEGKNISGLKVVEGSSRRKWIADLAAIKANLNSLGVLNATKEVMKTLGEVEKELVREFGRKDAKAHLESLVTRTKPSLSIVTADDPRPAITTAIDVFINHNEGDEND